MIGYPLASRIGFALAALTLAFMVGCGFSFSIDGNSNGNSQDNDNDNSADPDVVVIRFENRLMVTDVDTEFYATNQELDDPASELFDPVYRIQVGIGAAGTGILLAGTEDQIEFPCTEHLVMGTPGGSFKNPDTGETLGTGDLRIASVGFIFDCGDTLTFVYDSDGSDYTTDVEL